MTYMSHNIRKMERLRKERNIRLRWLLTDVIGAVAVFAIPVVGIYIAYGLGF